MATIDDRIVSMAFDNKKFEAGVKTSMASLDKLKASLKFDGVGKGFDKINAASKRTDLSGVTKGIEEVKNQFGAMRVVGLAVLASIATRAVAAGGQVAKSFTAGPIIEGFREYELKLGSIQTILSNTKAAGTNLEDVNKTLRELNHYADKTIYNFGQMTKNIGTFTAAGVDLETATTSIKGIANLAALSGSNAEQASTAMYQLSQAISSGRVSLQDWNSVVNAGMGGSVFQRALAQTAVAMGEIDDSALKLEGKMKNVKINGQSFRESIMAKPGEQSWLTSDVLTNTLSQLSGDLSDAELKAQGFSEAQIKAIKEQAKMAVDAATQVKTFSQLVDTTKEAITSGWAETWEIIFGNFKEAKKLFTGVSEVLGGWISKSAEARNKILGDWKEMGGRTLLLDAIKRAFEALKAVLAPIKKAFRDIFPAKTGKDLLTLTQRFREFTKTLKPSPETVENLRRIFRGFFAVLDIGKMVLQGVWSGIKKVFDAIGDGSGNFLDFGGSIGDLIVSFRDWLKEGDKIKDFFEVIGSVIATPFKLITGFIGLIQGAGTKAFTGFGNALGSGSKGAELLSAVWERVIAVFEKVKSIVQPIIQKVGETAGNLADILAKAIKNADFDNVFAALQVALIGGIGLSIKKALGDGLKVDIGQGLFANMSKTIGTFGGTLGQLSGAFKGLNGVLVSLQNNIKANTLLQISVAVGLLAGSLTILSMIKPKKLDNAMSAVTVSLAQLIGSLAVLGSTSGKGATFAKLPVIASALIALSTAIGLLSVSLLLLSTLDWKGLARGLTGVGGLLTALSVAVIPLSKAGPGMVIAGAGATALGLGLIVLSGAVKIFSLMDWEAMGKGLAGVVASLAAVALASHAISPAILLIGPGLIAVGIGLTAIGGAVKIFASMDTGELARGILGMAGALVAIGLAVLALPPTMPFIAAGLILVGIALASIGASVALMGNMKTETLVKGILGIGAALLVLAIGLSAMSGAIPGTIALLGASVALAALVPIIGIFGKMSWGTLFKGLAGMTLAILALGAAGTVAAPGMVALGLGLLALGTGIYLITTGLVKLGKDGGKGIAVAMAAMGAFVALLPKLIIDFLKGLVEIIAGIAKVAPQVVDSALKIVAAFASGIVRAMPSVEKASIALILGILKVLRKTVPDFIRTGFMLLISLLKGIDNNITKVTKLVVNIVAKFLKALADRAPALISAGADLLVAILKGIANNIERVLKAGAQLIVSFLKGIANNLPDVIKAGAEVIVKLLKGIGNNIDDVVSAGGDAISGFVRGIGKAARKVVTAGVDTASKFVHHLAKEIPRLADNVATAVIKLINNMAKVVDKRSPEFFDALSNLGRAIVQGIIDGMWSMLPDLEDMAEKLASKIPGPIKKLLQMRSPSKVMEEIGKKAVDGLIDGLEKVNPFGAISSSASGILNGVTNAMKALLPKHQRILNGLGQDLSKEFWHGILAIPIETNQVDEAFTTMGDNLGATIAATKQKIKDLKKDLRDDLSGDGLASVEVLRKRQAAIVKEQKLLEQLLAGNKQLNHGFDKEKARMKELVVQFNDVSEALLDAEDALAAAEEARKSAMDSFSDSFDDLPSIFDEDAEGNQITITTGQYIQALKDRAKAVQEYAAILAQLRAAGLDDETYQMLLEQGTAGQEFAEQLMAGGPAAIAEVNSLSDGLVTTAGALGQAAGHALYDAGVAAAQGLVDGLKAEQSKIFTEMIGIANLMVKAIKKALGIKSPSRVFAEMGKFTMEGMAKGLTKSSKNVTDAVVGVSKDALSAMKESMKKVSEVVGDNIDTNPTITPVLDLSDVQNGSKSLQDMMNVVPITAAASYGQATSISSEQEAARIAAEALAQESVIKFEQNNYSPESLSPIEIYRQTKNQLAQARPVLT